VVQARTQEPSELATKEPDPTIDLRPDPLPLPIADAIELPRLRPGAKVDLTSVHMTTSESGWGTSGWHILRTEEGGNSWQDVTPPESRLLEPNPPEEAIGDFSDSSNAWVVFLDLKSSPMMLTVWTTRDGGLSWAASTPVFPPGAGEFFEAYLRVYGIWNGWLLTDTIVMGTGRNDAYRLFQTQDGGRTWSEFILFPYVVTDIEFLDPSQGWMAQEKTGLMIASPHFSASPWTVERAGILSIYHLQRKLPRYSKNTDFVLRTTSCSWI
jgi:hypothetical protein